MEKLFLLLLTFEIVNCDLLEKLWKGEKKEDFKSFKSFYVDIVRIFSISLPVVNKVHLKN